MRSVERAGSSRRQPAGGTVAEMTRSTTTTAEEEAEMTTMTEIEVRCAVCGTLARKATLTSTSSFGPPDLDLRPNGPARWALESAGAALRRLRLLRAVDRRGAPGCPRGRRVAHLPRGARALEAPAGRAVALLRRARRGGRRSAGELRLAVPRGGVGLRRQERHRAGADLPGAGGGDVRQGARRPARPSRPMPSCTP